MTTFSLEWWKIILAGVSTLAIFSFLIGENRFYRFFEHLFIGIATGIGTMATVRSFLWPQLFQPLLGYDRILLPDHSWSEPYDENKLLLLLPAAFGMLYYFLYSRRHSWIAQIVIGFSIGIGGGLAFQGTLNEMIPQITDSFRPLYVPNPNPEMTTLGNIVFIGTLLSALSYFFFTFRRKEQSLVSRSANVGRVMMMICFGAFFGATIMARMALLVERLDFLIHEWLPALWG